MIDFGAVIFSVMKEKVAPEEILSLFKTLYSDSNSPCISSIRLENFIRGKTTVVLFS